MQEEGAVDISAFAAVMRYTAIILNFVIFTKGSVKQMNTALKLIF
jgi:hypothetical protein